MIVVVSPSHSLVVVLLFSKHLSFTMSARAAGATNLTQGSENFGYSAVRLRRIVKLQFGIVNPQEMVSFVCVCLLNVGNWGDCDGKN